MLYNNPEIFEFGDGVLIGDLRVAQDLQGRVRRLKLPASAFRSNLSAWKLALVLAVDAHSHLGSQTAGLIVARADHFQFALQLLPQFADFFLFSATSSQAVVAVAPLLAIAEDHLIHVGFNYGVDEHRRLIGVGLWR